MYEFIKERVATETAKALNKAIEAIKDSSSTRNNYLTPYRRDQLKSGKITEEKATALALDRADKKAAKRLEKSAALLERIAQAANVRDVTIDVEWRRNATWGFNPHAVVTVHTTEGYAQYEGRASGCGYDKRTAAVGEALNKCESIIKMLCDIKERKLARGIMPATDGYTVESNAPLIHYGAGYGAIPYFEGGVGMSSFQGVFEACGFKLTHSHGTKYTDYYCFERI